MTAEKLFQDQLDALQMNYGLELEGSTIGAKINHLSEICADDENLAEQISMYSLSASQQIGVAAKTYSMRTGNIFNIVARFIFSSLISGAVYSYERKNIPVPKRQHWLPIAYLRAFSTESFDSKIEKKKRKISINGVSAQNGCLINFTTDGDNFIHSANSDGEGFYQPAVERFFYYVETSYANAYRADESIHSLALMTSFFIVQSVRSPHPATGKFTVNDLEGVTNRIIENMNEFNGSIYCSFYHSGPSIPFAPYIPPRIRVLSNGAKVLVMPIDLRTNVIISTKSIESIGSTKRLCSSVRRDIIHHTHRVNGALFGNVNGLNGGM